MNQRYQCFVPPSVVPSHWFISLVSFRLEPRQLLNRTYWWNPAVDTSRSCTWILLQLELDLEPKWLALIGIDLGPIAVFQIKHFQGRPIWCCFRRFRRLRRLRRFRRFRRLLQVANFWMASREKFDTDELWPIFSFSFYLSKDFCYFCYVFEMLQTATHWQSFISLPPE